MASLPSVLCIFLLSVVVGVADSQQVCMAFVDYVGYDQVFQAKIQLDCVKSIMTVSMSAKSGSWVGIGFNGAEQHLMSGADLYLGIERCNSTPTILDQYGPEKNLIAADTQNNVFNTSWSIANGNATYTFSRYFNTGDPRDFVIQPGALTLLWGYRVNAGFGRHLVRDWTEVDLFEKAPACCTSLAWPSTPNTTTQPIATFSTPLKSLPPLTFTTTGSSSSPCPVAPAQRIVFSLDMWMDYYIDCGARTLTALVWARTTGWVGVGFNSNENNMYGSDFVVGMANCENQVAVNEYFLLPTSVNITRIPSSRGTNNSLSETSFARNSTGSYLRFTRPLTSKFANGVSIAPGSMWVFGASRTDDYFQSHSRRYSVPYNFFTATPAPTPAPATTSPSAPPSAPTPAPPTPAPPTPSPTVAPTPAAPTPAPTPLSSSSLPLSCLSITFSAFLSFLSLSLFF